MTEEVQGWVASPDVSQGRYAALARTLPPDEKERATSLTPVAARRFVVARGILRKLLAGFTGTTAEKLQFSYGHAGKPVLIDRDDIHFNVSHSADLGLFAFAPDRPVGVDVENERPVRRLLDVAQRFMSDEELRTLAGTAEAERNSAVLRAWWTREARLKAQGKGVWDGPTRDVVGRKIAQADFVPQTGY